MATRIDPLKFIGPAAINRQCCEDYFYGEDGSLEDLLSQIEMDIAPVLVKVADQREFTRVEQGTLRWLAVVMHLRTRKVAEAAKVLPRRIAYEFITHQIACGKLPEPKGGYTSDMMDFGGVPNQLLQQAIPCVLEMQTLFCTLLEAGSNDHFITSDNPAILMNQLFADAEPHRSFAGFSRSGFQLLMPISPKVCVFFYDPKVYSAGSRRCRLVKLSTKDVEIVNSLQVISAEHCLYFHHANLEGEVTRLARRYAPNRKPLDDLVRELPDETTLHCRSPGVILPKVWNFCRLKKTVRIGPDKRRNADWTHLVELVEKDIEDNRNGQGLRERVERILGEEL